MAQKSKVSHAGNELTDIIYKKHKSVIQENHIDINRMSYEARNQYNECVTKGIGLSPMELILNTTNRILSYEGNVPSEYTFDELPKLRIRVTEDAQSVKELYMSILNYITMVDIKDYGMLVQILRTLQSFRSVGLFHTALQNIQIEVINHSWADNKICKSNLSGAIYNTLSITGITDLHIKQFESEYIERKIAEITLLERKGDVIIRKKYRDWYETHKFDNNKWRELTEHERNTYHNPFPWHIIRERYHRIKENQVFVLSPVQKIKVLQLDTYSELVNYALNKTENVLYNRDHSYISSNIKQYLGTYDYLQQSMLIAHIGEVNNGLLQVVSIYELKEILENAGVIGRYSNKI